MLRRILVVLLAAGPLLAGGGGEAYAQDSLKVSAQLQPSSNATPMDVPFETSEELRYNVKLGIMNVGKGYMRVASVEDIRGRPTYHVQLGLDGRVLFVARVRYNFDSWMDVETLASRRFVQDSYEINRDRYRAYDIFPEERRWERIGVDKGGETITDTPLDQVSFLYYIRTLPLEVGDEYVLNQYFEEDGNPVIIKVLRKERREVPAGTFDTVVIQPIIQTSGLFGEGGKAEIYLTDDDKRQMVYMRSEIPLVGSVTLHLTEIR